DVAELGGRILVVMDKDKAKGDALATAIGQEFVSMRGKTMPSYFGVDEGITAALETNESPVVMADPADNAGGGAPSDNTTILRGRADRRHRCRADQQPHAGARPRALHQSRHRSPRQESGGREVDKPFHGGLWPDRQAGDLHRFRWPPQPRLSKNSLHQGGAADL